MRFRLFVCFPLPSLRTLLSYTLPLPGLVGREHIMESEGKSISVNNEIFNVLMFTLLLYILFNCFSAGFPHNFFIGELERVTNCKK